MNKAIYEKEALKAAIKEGKGSQRVRGAWTLLEMKMEQDLATAVVGEEIRSLNKEVVASALSCCGELKLYNEKILKGLCEALADEELMVDAISAVRQIGRAAKLVGPQLVGLYAKPEIKGERKIIIRALGSVDPESEQSQKLFVSCILDKEAAVGTRIEAIWALGRSGREGRANIPLLEKLVMNEKREKSTRLIRLATVEAIFRIQPEHKDLVNWLCELLSDSDPEANLTERVMSVGEECIKMLGQIGPRAARALPLIEKHRRYYPKVVAEAVKLIEKR